MTSSSNRTLSACACVSGGRRRRQGAHLERVLVLDAAVLAQGVVEPSAVGLAVRGERVEAVVCGKDVPGAEGARGRVYEGAGDARR